MISYLKVMPLNDKAFMELAFNQRISYSQREKVKEFWKFYDSKGSLKLYEIPSVKEPVQEECPDETPSKFIRKIWRERLKVFREHGLDKAVLDATETCKLCETDTDYKYSELADEVQEPYEELLDDMKAFDERTNNKTKSETEIERKISCIS